MKFSFLSLVLFLIAPLAWASASVQKAPAFLLRFDRMPLGNVARVFSARYGTTVTITANATAPITGDFSSMDLKPALAAAAKQAGLVVVSAGPGASAGFCLVESRQVPAAEPAPVPVSQIRSAASTRIALVAAAKRRAELLERRKDLLDQTALEEY